MNAVDVMTPYPQTVRPDALLVDAAKVMQQHHVRHLPVVDATSTVVGMLSERDVRTAIGDPAVFIDARDGSYSELQVRDVMSRPPVVIAFDAPLSQVAHGFVDHRFGAMPVVDKFGALLGILSYVDILRSLTRAA